VAGKYWHDYWASGGSGESALTKPAQRTLLAQHWRGLFAERAPQGSVVLDIGCGDGAIFGFVRDLLGQVGRGLTLIALDSSDAAARGAMRATPGTNGVASDASRLPFGEGTADLVVSQFGLEYAGGKAFEEAARVLKPGGTMSAVCHYKQGSISAECAENLRILDIFFDEKVIDRAKETLGNSFAQRYAPTAPGKDVAEKKFQQAVRRVTNALADAPNSAAKVTLSSAMIEINTMAMRRTAYDSTEAFAFLDEVKRTLTSYRARMRSMLGAALDQPAVDQIVTTLESAGMKPATAEPMSFESDGSFSAWRIEARRD
jgi:ubiquinone/menaquinone biosynthesis C-methylase UbiE